MKGVTSAATERSATPNRERDELRHTIRQLEEKLR
jgi:hypothetical protein